MSAFICFALFLSLRYLEWLHFFLYGDCVFFVCFAKRILGNSMKLPDRHFRML